MEGTSEVGNVMTIISHLDQFGETPVVNLIGKLQIYEGTAINAEQKKEKDFANRYTLIRDHFLCKTYFKLNFNIKIQWYQADLAILYPKQ